MITLRFVTGNDLVSGVIRGGEMGFWASHVEAVMLDGTLLGAHSNGGVQARPAGYDRGECRRELIVTIASTADEFATWEGFLRSQVGKPYDMTAIGEMALGTLTGEAPNWKQSGAWICSALMVAGLLSAGILKSAPTTVRLATPRDVLCMLAPFSALQ